MKSCERAEPGTHPEPSWWKKNYPEIPEETIHDVDWEESCLEEEFLQEASPDLRRGVLFGIGITLVMGGILWQIWHILR